MDIEKYIRAMIETGAFIILAFFALIFYLLALYDPIAVPIGFLFIFLLKEPLKDCLEKFVTWWAFTVESFMKYFR